MNNCTLLIIAYLYLFIQIYENVEIPTISTIVIYPVENTMALGGVATGNINAKLVAQHAVTMR